VAYYVSNMSTNKKIKNNLLKLFSNGAVLGTALTATQVKAGGEGGGGGGGGVGDYSDTSVTNYNAVEGTEAADGLSVGSYEADFDDDGTVDATMDVRAAPSTPFLAVWNGQQYVHENDFLFGKPNTVFANYKMGVKAYEQGIGGDTYLLSDTLRADEKGELRMQIRELEPEESYIDKFSISALDLKENEHFVADGNLEDSYVFDTTEAKVVDGVMNHYHAKQNDFTSVSSTYTTLTPKEGESVTMQTGDELVIRVPKIQLDSSKDTFVLIDSHFRDWSLGNQVPFSRLEKFMIQSVALGRSGATTLAGIALLASVAFVGLNKADSDVLAKLLSVPHSYADYTIGSITRSLVISAGDSFGQTYLQTLFPRYVQATQEVVRIPKEIIASLKDEFLTLRIKATKKHKVRAAFAFQGTALTPAVNALSIQKVVNPKTGADYTEQIKEKNNVFLHTIPGDVMDVVIKDLPKVSGTSRRYVLRANGFYTRMSAATAATIGKNWLERLAPEDRTLLKDLRLS